jgi:hypothetical protein
LGALVVGVMKKRDQKPGFVASIDGGHGVLMGRKSSLLMKSVVSESRFQAAPATMNIPDSISFWL